MTASHLHLVITTPASILADDAAIRSMRAEDASGSFGILPGHVDLLTVLPASVVRWQRADGTMRYCALRGGVMTMSAGTSISIACRWGMIGDDLDRLSQEVRALQHHEADAERQARVEHMRAHTRAVRQIMNYLRPEGGYSAGKATTE
jgi:F-type H+-transporting ATPase subunit epsilon